MKKISIPVKILVGAAGFEPTLTESESGVLPLNYAPSPPIICITNTFCKQKF